MVKFGSGEELRPRGGVIGAENTEIDFKFLIGSFRLTICLGVVCHGQLHIILQEMGQFSGEDRGELGTSIRDEGIV